ncbi:hypothetical protein KM043_006399 [Ampulex compressa]|nr:hypothetical protein KM043_006399 [Ampulex compressa]
MDLHGLMWIFSAPFCAGASWIFDLNMNLDIGSRLPRSILKRESVEVPRDNPAERRKFVYEHDSTRKDDVLFLNWEKWGSVAKNYTDLQGVPMSRIVILLIAVLAIHYTMAQPITCNKPNEEYQCGSACQTTCVNLGQPCPIVNIRCNDACYCKAGYARNTKGVCIPISQCPGRT